ncbi:MAG: BatD family protein [Verrucomicrobiota bacterium]
MLSNLWDYLDPGFLAPWWLLAAVVAMAGLAALEVRAYYRRRQAIGEFAAAHLVPDLTGSVSFRKRVLKSALLVAAAGLLFVALARPHLFFDWSDETRSGLDVLLAVDTSRSMLTEDVHPNRLERAKLAIADFADQLPDNRLGLIAFAGDAFLQCPLTLDHDAFQTAVQELDTSTIPRPGTDIATAIDEAVDALHSQPNNLKFLILVTDGEDLEGRAITAAKNAAQNGLRIYTVGVGTPNGDRIPERDDSGAVTYHRDAGGQEVVSHLDDATLQQIADVTGGAYVPLGQDGEGLGQIYDRYIATLPKQNLEERRQKIPLERFEWPLALAILLLMAQFMINERTKVPDVPATGPARRPLRRRRALDAAAAAPALAAACLLALTPAPARSADTDTPERAYKSGDYQDAEQGYEKAAQNAPARSELEYNRGDAAYKAGDFSEAETAFRKALESPNLGLQERTYYNLGNTQYQHGAALMQASTRKTIKLWKAALHSYECALQLKDSADARHNYQVVKEKLDELRQQLKQRGHRGMSQPNQEQNGDPSQGQSPNGDQSGGMDGDDDSDDDDQNGQSGGQSNNDSANGGNGGQKPANGGAGNGQQQTVRAYSGTRRQDQQDPRHPLAPGCGEPARLAQGRRAPRDRALPSTTMARIPRRRPRERIGRMTPFLRRAPRFLFLLLASAGALSAATVSVQVEPAQAAVGDAVTLTVTVQNGTMGRIDLPAVDGLQAVQETTTKMLSNSGGVFTVSTSQTFRLTPRRPGDFTIPGFDVPLQEGGTLRAKEVRLHVAGDAGDPGGTASAAAPGTPPDSSAATPPPPDIPAPPANNAPATPPTATPTPSAGPVILPPPGSSSLASPDAAAGANASPGGNDPTAQTVPRDPDGGPSKVFMLITPQTTDAYVGQLVPLRIDFYIRMEVMADQNSLPTIKGSDFLMNNFTVRGRASLIVLDGEQYECDTWLTAIAAPKAGDFPLAMERDTYWVKSVTSGGYDLFGLNRHSNLAHEMISSNGYTMHVHPLPVEGRPPHFTGAIGHFEVTGDAQPATVAVGEPVTLSFTVDGDGNFDYVRCPALADDPEWRTYTPSSRTNFRDEARTRGEKLFEQAVIPLKNGNVPLPACSFSYFDPTTKNYVTIRSTCPPSWSPARRVRPCRPP